MFAVAAVDQLVTGAPNDAYLAAQLGHQRVAAGVADEQLRRKPQAGQVEVVGVKTMQLQALKDARQPALIGLLDGLGRNVHAQVGVMLTHGRLSGKRVPGTVDGLEAVTADQLAVALHQEATAAHQPLLAPGTVHPGQQVPRQLWQIVVHQVQIVVEKQPGPGPGRFVEHCAVFRPEMGAVLIVGTDHVVGEK